MVLGLCQCGCGQAAPIAKTTTLARGWVKGQPKKYIRGHFSPLRLDIDTMYRVDPGKGCWVWLGSLEAGYGRIGQKLAYRIFWERKNGPQPKDRELQLDHVCRNRACVNPDHLELVPRTVNIRRGLAARFTECQVFYIHERLRAGESMASIAREYDVTPGCISQIKHGRAWRDIYELVHHA